MLDRSVACRISLMAILVSVAWVPERALAAPGDFAERDVEVVWQVQGQDGSSFGWAVATIADLDDDGVLDALVGAPSHDEGDGAGGLEVVLSGRSGEELFRFVGEPGEALGYAMADAGDTDGDTINDIIVGAPGGGVGGRAYIYSGADGSLLRVFAGEAAGGGFGVAVAGAGDLDGDQLADVLVGAENADFAGENSGRVYLLSGGDGSVLDTLDGPGPGARFGSATATAGDIDGDGVLDPFIGARDAGRGQAGLAYVYSGATSRLIHELSGGENAVDIGWFFVAGLGDVNRDGVSDLYVGDFSSSVAGASSGRVHVFSGADGTTIYEISENDGRGAGQGLGPGRGAGDVNGDGIIDVVAGSYLSSDGASQAGKLTIFSGADASVIRTMTSLEAGENLGFDAVGIGDANRDKVVDLLAAAATGDTVYVLAGKAGDNGGTSTTAAGTTSMETTATNGTTAVGGSSVSSSGSRPTSSTAAATASPAETTRGVSETSADQQPDVGGGCQCRTERGQRRGDGVGWLGLIALGMGAGFRRKRGRGCSA